MKLATVFGACSSKNSIVIFPIFVFNIALVISFVIFLLSILLMVFVSLSVLGVTAKSFPTPVSSLFKEFLFCIKNQIAKIPPIITTPVIRYFIIILFYHYIVPWQVAQVICFYYA